MLFGRLQIVFLSDFGRVAEPRGDDMQRKGLDQLRFPSASKVLPRLAPRFDPGAAADAMQFASQIGILAAIAMDAELGTVRRLIEGGFEMRQEFREERHRPRFMPHMPLRFGTRHDHASSLASQWPASAGRRFSEVAR